MKRNGDGSDRIDRFARQKGADRTAAATGIAAYGHIPRCTYRLQLSAAFGFAEAAELAGYLAELGVSHCYTSPFFKAHPGSHHGYDVVDPNAFNPELGDEAAFFAFSRQLAERGLSLLVDTVPNHLGVMGADNPWWLDVLENGPASIHAGYFDIDWRPQKKALHHRILVPVLADQYGSELEAGRLQLAFDPAEGSFAIRYFDHLFPLDPRTYPLVLRRTLTGPQEEADDGAAAASLRQIVELCEHLPGRRIASRNRMPARRAATGRIKERLAALAAADRAFAAALDTAIRQLNGSPGERASFVELHHLLERQVFRLSYWKVAAEEINYRRFFDINDLAGLRVEREEVFTATHRLLFRLVAEGVVAGIRIDHLDGLYDPAAYLRRLQRRLHALMPDRALYLIVEKILAAGERLPSGWPVHGTTGYDFAALVDSLLLDGNGLRELERTYRRVSGSRDGFERILRDSKKRILERSLAGELSSLASRLDRLSERDWRSRDFTLQALRQALVEVIAGFPVYRTYAAAVGMSDSDRQAVQTAVWRAKWHNPGDEHSIFDFIEALLLQRPERLPGRRARREVRDFVLRFQQLTAPVTAKGLEDTAGYRYNRLVARCEVGSDPGRFALSVEEFHQANRERLAGWPHSLLATSTHDSKRSEDVRARLAVLSEATVDWRRAVGRWRRQNRGLGGNLHGRRLPDADTEYALYQNLMGIWPLCDPDEQEWLRLRQRLADYMLKAVREAKLHTSWRNPNEAYEAAIAAFVERLFADSGSPFWRDFLELHRRLAPCGLYNSLSQLLLKMISPGVPDIYQGCELWNFSLVDPDSRRPVDFTMRKRLLREMQTRFAGDGEWGAELGALLADVGDGRLKLYLTWRCLQLRRRLPELFAGGGYRSLGVEGTHRRHVCAVLRRHQGQAVLAVAPRLFYALTGGDPAVKPLAGTWNDTTLVLPEDCCDAAFVCQLTGQRLRPERSAGRLQITLARLLGVLPVALCHSDG